jgi:prepilin peptidase CpaA
VTFPAIGLGVLVHTFTAGLDGLFFSLLGIVIGFGLLIFPYLLGGMAAGDVKLLMAIGALKGTAFTFGSFIYIAIIGGIIAVIILVMKKEFSTTIKRMIFSLRLQTLDGLNKNEIHHAFPYGVAIVLGTGCYLGVNLL